MRPEPPGKGLDCSFIETSQAMYNPRRTGSGTFSIYNITFICGSISNTRHTILIIEDKKKGQLKHILPKKRVV